MDQDKSTRKKYNATYEYYNSVEHYVYDADRESFITITYRGLHYYLTIKVGSHNFEAYQKCFSNPLSIEYIAGIIAYEFSKYKTSEMMLKLLEIGAASIKVDLVKYETTHRQRTPERKSFILAEIAESYINRENDTPSFTRIKRILLDCYQFYEKEDTARRHYNRIIGTVSFKESNEIKSMIEEKKPRGRPRKHPLKKTYKN